MTTNLALVRGINVGGHKMVPMADLRDLAASLRLTAPRSLMQSGNLVFQSGDRGAARLERLLESAIAKRFDLEPDVFVRTAEEWMAVIEQNPFGDEAKQGPSHLLVMFLKHAPEANDVKALRAVIAGREVVHAKGRQAYIIYPGGIGRSRLTSSVIEKKLGTRGTARNWNTVLKLHALASLMRNPS